MMRTLLLGTLAASTLALPALPACAQTSTATVDSAEAEIDIGRYWHASVILRDAREQAGATPEGTLLLARAEAGYFAWPRVVELLEGESWLDRVGGGEGWSLLGRALGEEGLWEAAADAWGRYRSTDHARAAEDLAAVEARHARALALAGREDAARALVDSLSLDHGMLSSFTALGLVRGAADRGDTAAVRAWSDRLVDAEARSRGWEATPAARLAAGDSAGAREAYLAALADVTLDLSASSRARAWLAIGRLSLARGDTAAARSAFAESMEAAARSASGGDSAELLLRLGIANPDRALAAARALASLGRPGPALDAYDRHAELTGDAALPEAARLQRARLMARERSRRDEAVREFRALSTSADPDVGAGALEAWAGLRRSQGRTGDVDTLREWLLERYPSSGEAMDVVFFRGDAAHDRNDLDEAYDDYERLQAMNPAHDRAGLARMRMGMIHLHRDRPREAVRVFRGYLEDFPDGRRWDEATYWSGRTLRELGETGAGNELLRSIGTRDPTSFYAFEAAELLGEPHRLPGMADTVVPPMPAWLPSGLEVVDHLGSAGLEEGRAVAVDRLVERARDESGDALLRLALELADRDLGLHAVNLGWELRREGRPWSRALLRTIYPFPYMDMVVREARERRVDPFWVAGLIRQESAFDPDIRSSAGAIGLMQVMPATGRQLADAEGPDDFSVQSLETPEVNLHLGTAYMRDMWERFDGRIPLILSAYNAGPHRAVRWKDFPEAEDRLRLVERIPFGETREYVKLVSRNRALYEMLWGDVVERVRPVS